MERDNLLFKEKPARRETILDTWNTDVLENLCSLIADCPHSTPKWTDSGVFVVRSWNVRNGVLNFDKTSFTDEKTYEERIRRAKPSGGDIVITREAPMGEVAMIPDDIKCCLGQRLVLLRPNPEKINKRFLLYSLQSRFVQNQILSNEGTGSTVSNLRIPDLKGLKIRFPSLEEQEKIANTFWTIDEKIELNRQIAQTLEAIAQAIFKEWFVDFNFPGATGEMQESELGEIPKGWRVGELSEVISIKHGFAFKGEFFSDEETDDILLTPGNFKIGGGFNYSKFKYYKGEFPSEYTLNQGDIVVTMTDLSKDGDTLGYSALIPSIEGKRLLHNQRIGKILFREKELNHYIYFLLQQDGYRNFVLGSATGSTVRHTSPSRICEYRSVTPPIEILNRFNLVIQPLLDMMGANFQQIKTLTQLRESLLPKLIKGEIKL